MSLYVCVYTMGYGGFYAFQGLSLVVSQYVVIQCHVSYMQFTFSSNDCYRIDVSCMCMCRLSWPAVACSITSTLRTMSRWQIALALGHTSGRRQAVKRPMRVLQAPLPHLQWRELQNQVTRSRYQKSSFNPELLSLSVDIQVFLTGGNLYDVCSTIQSLFSCQWAIRTWLLHPDEIHPHQTRPPR